MNRSNIISIHAGGQTRENPLGRRQLVDRSHQMIKSRIMPAVTEMLGRTDGILIEMAGRASGTSTRNLYLEALHEFRLKRNVIESDFAGQLERMYVGSLRGYDQSNPRGNDPAHMEKPVPAGAAGMTASLLVNDAVNKISSECRGALFALDRYMGFLLNDPKLESHINPVSPEIICNAFYNACRPLESGIVIRMILFRLFEDYVITVLPEAYREVNALLAEQHIQTETASSGCSSSPDAAQTESDREPRHEDNTGRCDPYSALQELLGLKTQDDSIRNAAENAGGDAANADIDGLAELTRILSNLSLIQRQYAAVIGRGGLAAKVPLMERNIIRELLEGGAFAAASPSDGRVIELVSMIFDCILADDDIPVPVKMQLGCLQAPLLKAALLDKTLFFQESHPIRRFLDTVVHAAVGWRGMPWPDLAERVETAVKRILNEFEDDVGLFNEILSDVEAWLNDHERGNTEHHARTGGLSENREQMEVARRQIKNMIADRVIANPMVPDFVTEFLLRHWSEVLLQTFIHEGQESPAWKRAIEVVDRLIWSLMPKKSTEERRELTALLPHLLTEIKAGLEQIDMDEASSKVFLEQLGECHAEAVRPAGIKAEPVQPSAPGLQDPLASPEYEYEPQPIDLSCSPFLHPELLQQADLDRDDDTIVQSAGQQRETAIKHAADPGTGNATIRRYVSVFDRAISNVIKKIERSAGSGQE